MNIKSTSGFSALTSNVTVNTQVIGLSGAGLSYYITDVVVSNGATAQNLQVVSSATAGNACATSPVAVTPLLFEGASVTTGIINFQTPIKVTANSAVCCTHSGTTAFSCLVSGYTAP